MIKGQEVFIRKLIKSVLNEVFSESGIVLYHATNNKFELRDMILPAHFFNNMQAAEDMGAKYIFKVRAEIKNPLRCYDEDVQVWDTNTVRGTLKGSDGGKQIATEKEIQHFENKYGDVGAW